jgi:DNA-binding NarL/FixJ family response regulator
LLKLGATEKAGVVLIVDDVPSGIHVIAHVLSDLYDVMVATNGEDAIAAASEHLPDVILLDVDMPGMNGLEVCRRLKRDRRTGGIPVIFVTALGSELDEVAGLREDAADYLTKPIRPEALRLRVARHVKANQERMRALSGAGASSSGDMVALSPRELECLKLLASGRLNDRIADALGISTVTVEFHLRNAKTKLGAATREQALAKAIVLGLI